MNDSSLQFSGPDLREIAWYFSAMMLPPRTRRLWMARMSRMVIAQAKRNVAEQKTVDGSPMKPRKRPPPKTRPVYHRDGSVTEKNTHEKMLVDIVKSTWLRVDLVTEDLARVGFSRNVGEVAFRHQYGIAKKYVRKTIVELFNAEQITPGNAASYAKVTRNVAIELKKSGVRESVIEIQRGWTMFQAAVYLSKTKQVWRIPTPARPFLGLDGEQVHDLGNELLNGIYDRFKAKNHSRLLK